MRILYILPYVPWPIKVTCFNLIPRLAERHEIHLLCLSDGKADSNRLPQIAKKCKSLRVIPHSKIRRLGNTILSLPTAEPLRIGYCRNQEMEEAVKERIDAVKPDVICVERWRALQYVPQNCTVPTVCHPIDSMTLYNQRLMRMGAWWEKIVGAVEYSKFLTYEAVLARRADVALLCSAVDLEVVRRAAPDAELNILPNGVDCKQFYFKDDSEEDPNTMVFTGSFLYRPNQHAMDWFVAKIFPKIRKVVPEARLFVVGKAAKAFFARKLPISGIEVHDFVPELRPFMARGTVAVAPMTVGSGVSCKVLEAFSTGTAVVTTRMACGDLPVRNGEHLLLAENADKFAEQIILLLRDVELRQRLRHNARRLVEEKYDWEKVTKRLESILLQTRTPTGVAPACVPEQTSVASAVNE
jgi:glycosyltransferase involved in cell wall biosynthesis